MRFADPKANIDRFRLELGMTVADFGAGSGLYTLAAARAVGLRGAVYAIDIQQELLRRIKNAAAREGLDHVEVIWGDIEQPKGSTLPDNSLDAVILSNVLFLAEDKAAIVKEIARVLKRNGKVLVIDWKDSFGGLGPDTEHIVTEGDAKELFRQGGFSVEQGIQAGAHHYGLICKKKVSAAQETA